MGDQVAAAENRTYQPGKFTYRLCSVILIRNIPKGWTKSNPPMYEDSVAIGAMIKARNVAYAMDPLGLSGTWKGGFCLN